MTRLRLLGLTVVLAVLGVVFVVVGVGRGAPAERALPHPFHTPPSSTPPSLPATAPTASGTGSDGTSVPTRLTIGALHVKAPIVPVGSTSDGQVEIPARPSTLGWWAAGAAPGAPAGNAVIVGHVDDARTGPGALFHLDAIRRDQHVSIAGADGRRSVYRVESLHVVHKTSGLPAKYFASDGRPRLVIITCGGPFDRTTHNYADNIVAIADRI